MAHFAEIDKNNKVLRVIVIDNNDVNLAGGDYSITAEEKVKTIVPFTTGVRWVQTSYNKKARKKYAGIGDTYDPIKDKFISRQPYSSWLLDANDDWQTPVAYPTITTYGDNIPYFIYWDENNQRWTGKDDQNNEFYWIPQSLSWLATGN
jgi:hypothetical protein